MSESTHLSLSDSPLGAAAKRSRDRAGVASPEGLGVSFSESWRQAAEQRVCPECGQTGAGPFCHHWDAGMERKVPAALLERPEDEQ